MDCLSTFLIIFGICKLTRFLMLTHQSGLRLVRGIVKDVQPNKLILEDGEEVPYGLLVWSTGVGPSFVKSLPFPKSPGGRYNRLVDPKIMYLFGFFAIFLYVYMFPPFEKLCPYTSM
jgi:hypothetical protein